MAAPEKEVPLQPPPPPQQQQQAGSTKPGNQDHAPVPMLSPLPAPGIFCLPQCIAHTPTAIVLKDKLFSFGGDAEIQSIDGQVMFGVRGSAFSMSRRKEVFDANGQLLFTVRAEVFSIPATFYCETPDGKRFMDISGKWSGTAVFKPKSEVSFINNANGEEIKIKLKNNYLDTHAEIKLENGHVIACIDRNFWSARSFFGGAQTYVLTVAPGMDIALCVAMCLAMDERMKARNGA